MMKMTNGGETAGRAMARRLVRAAVRLSALGALTGGLSGCFLIGGWEFPRISPAQTAPAASPAGMASSGQSVAALDTTTAAERRAAAEAGGGAKVGSTVASLGDPTVEGFWARTPLVSAPVKGRLADPRTGASVAVDLQPLAGPKGAGSQVSLAAMRALGVSLTDLPHLDVYRN